MKVLNCYAGIGGNRKLWTDCEITAVEIDPDIAKVYKHFFPDDTVIVGDAHEYLLNHYNEFDFIWVSPPCPTHSDIRRCVTQAGRCKVMYPDMSLYQEIILLQNFPDKKIKWVVENVKPYYEPLIFGVQIERHLFWTNFQITRIFKKENNRMHNDITGSSIIYDFDLSKFDITNKRKIIRNMVDPEIANHIFNNARNIEVKDKRINKFNLRGTTNNE